MRFLPDGPDIPPDLISAQERGEVLFVCGAGVSRTVGLPNFRGLVEGVYRELDEDWSLHPAESEGMRPGGSGQYDRVLRSLERRLAPSDSPRNRGMRARIRSAVRTVLRAPQGVNLANHLTLLRLSRDAEGRSRLATTNFDPLFERSWWDSHREKIPSHAGPAMPQPGVHAFTGVLHLHGRLADEYGDTRLDETDLVLTSAEFGDAYLRSGWASRYVYDLIRACTVVMVGYQADDPPMRYLLEALEADRQRYPDLQKLYAFVPASARQEHEVRALWSAKGVDPVPYRPGSEDDHSPLYNSLGEWARYADDPTGWRRAALGSIVRSKPGNLSETEVARALELLGHGDASQLLGELAPDAAWLAVFAERRLFNRETAQPGQWIAARVNDPEMIRACAGLSAIDDQSRWMIESAIERQGTALSPVRRKAWRLVLKKKVATRRSDLQEPWYYAFQRLKAGEVDYDTRRLVAKAVAPRLEVLEGINLIEAEETSQERETIHSLVRVDYRSADHPPAADFLKRWPDALDDEVGLFRTLSRVLHDALEESADAGFLDGWDRASSDVPSIAAHAQNEYHSGFYPLVRLIADLWKRIAEKHPYRAHTLAKDWANTPYLLLTRLYLYAQSFGAVFEPSEAAEALDDLGDQEFWLSDAQVEIMRIITSRWMEFSNEDRHRLEAQIRQGMPRGLFSEDRFSEEEWVSVHDSAIFKRLNRIEAAGGALTAESAAKLAEIAGRHPGWTPSSGDRDDFNTWHETRVGPSGHSDLLSNVPDGQLVREAMRLEEERRYEEGDLWRVFCSADPERALRGLRAESECDRWDGDAWRCLLWAAHEKGEPPFHREIGSLLLRAPASCLEGFLPAAVAWLQRRREVLAAPDHSGGPQYLKLWDKLADAVYVSEEEENAEKVRGDLSTSALNHPGGMLAWTLHDYLVAEKPTRGRGFGSEISSRFDRIADAQGRPGLLGRVFLARDLAYLDAVDPDWIAAKLVPRFSLAEPDAQALWIAHASGRLGSPRLFNALKPAFLEIFEKRDFAIDEWDGFVGHLMSAAILHRRADGREYALTAAQTKRALTLAPPEARRRAAWYLWRWMGEKEGEPADKAKRWASVFGPFFREIWPLDAQLRDEATSNNLVMMALDSEEAFPEVVETIIDFIVPFQMYHIAHSLRLESEHEALLQRYPRVFLRLTDATVDPARYPVPSDLGEFLKKCVEIDPGCASEPTYIRLFGLSRRRAA
jgi:SIR2-like domain